MKVYMKYHKWGCDPFYDSLSKCGEGCPAYVKSVDGCQHRKQGDCILAMEPMFENEKFSSKELRDITNVITVRSGMMQTTKGDLKAADAVVFKTDYLSHKQWYAVRDYAKKCGRKIIYCRNNISMMFEQIERALK